MALTTDEKAIVTTILFRAMENAKTMPEGEFLLATFADLTKPQQTSFIRTRVQMLRDQTAASVAAHTAEAATQLNNLNTKLAVLDGLLAKL